MGFFEYSDEHILNLAKVTCVDDFVASHPQGYDLLLRERGEGLSGGQRQSLNLVRSLLHDPNLLILDEPTSSMDTATEKKVLSNLKLWAKDKTRTNILLDKLIYIFFFNEVLKNLIFFTYQSKKLAL